LEVKPTKGLKVFVKSSREAVFEDESVSVRKVTIPDKNSKGVLTGMTLAGFAEVEMSGLDGKKHWYPVDSLKGEHGESVKEEEIEVQMEDDDGEDSEE